jgi:Asp-tRNA(Asn)/Glu-tRNA(Gln) amidotransferase B subunit
VELKNLNSVRFMQRAIEYEVARHIKVLESGGRLTQETRLWDDRALETRVMRSKEERTTIATSPEPDLPPLIVSSEFIQQIRTRCRSCPKCDDNVSPISTDSVFQKHRNSSRIAHWLTTTRTRSSECESSCCGQLDQI